MYAFINKTSPSYNIYGGDTVRKKRRASFFIVLLLFAAVLIFHIMGGQAFLNNITLNQSVLNKFIGDSVPVFYSLKPFDYDKFKNKIIAFVSPVSVIKNNVLAFNGIEISEPAEFQEEKEEELENAKPIEETTISYKTTKGYYTAEGVLVKNETTYDFNPMQLLDEALKFDFSGNGPQILIVHSHSSESYTATEKNYYLPSDPDRTEDVNYNIVRIGTEIASVLKKNGINALHNTTLHDYPSYNGSYKRSLATVEDYLKKYPSIKIVLDIHRDAIVKADGTKIKLVTEINGEKAAQIMLLSGSDQGGLEHPNWRENLKFAMKLQKKFNSMYPNLARPVSFTKERYNTHTTYASIIVEVGTTGNTLEEALVSAKCIGNVVTEFVKDNSR